MCDGIFGLTPPQRLDQPESRTGPCWLSDGLLVGEPERFQNVDSFVDAVQYLYRLRQVVVVDVVGGKSREVGRCVGPCPGVEEVGFPL